MLIFVHVYKLLILQKVVTRCESITGHENTQREEGERECRTQIIYSNYHTINNMNESIFNEWMNKLVIARKITSAEVTDTIASDVKHSHCSFMGAVGF